MTTDNLKDIEHKLNSTKNIFATTIVNETLGATRTLVQKTKNERAAERMLNAANDLAKVSLDIPDIVIGGGSTTPIAEPSVEIKYPNLMNRVFYQGAPIQLIFETKNVRMPYSCYVFANSAGNKTDLFVDQNIRFGKHTIPNILVNKQLPPGKYDIFIVLYDNNTGQRKQLRDSKGQPVVDNTQRIMGIEIRSPVATGTLTPDSIKGVLTEGEKKKKETKKEDIENAKIISTNPEIKITNKGDFHKVFAGSDNVPLIFEVKNIQKYTVAVFLQKDANNVIGLDTHVYNKQTVKLALPIRNILRGKIQQTLNLTEYKTLTVLLRDEKGNPLPGGNKLIDSVDISIAPLEISQRSVNSKSSHIRILKPGDSGSISSVGPIDLEFETDLPTPFSYTVNFPSAGGLVHAEDSNFKNVKTSFKPQHIYVDFKKAVALKKGVNRALEVHIYYPARSNTVVATQTIYVNII